MAIAQSRITAQGQVSVPAKVRQKLAVGPGSVLEWDEADGRIIVRRAGKYTFLDIHRALFKKPPRPFTVGEMDEAIKAHLRKKHARR